MSTVPAAAATSRMPAHRHGQVLDARGVLDEVDAAGLGLAAGRTKHVAIPARAERVRRWGLPGQSRRTALRGVVGSGDRAGCLVGLGF
jgi:hypothetical protein